MKKLALRAALSLTALFLSACNLIGPLINVALPVAAAKITFGCVPEHGMIDTPSGPQEIGHLRNGDTVIGFSGAPVRILQHHAYTESPDQKFWQISFNDGSTVTVSGKHRIAGVPAADLSIGQSLASRKVTAISHRTGVKHSFDLVTEDAGYRINGVPVNSMVNEMAKAAGK